MLKGVKIILSIGLCFGLTVVVLLQEAWQKMTPLHWKIAQSLESAIRLLNSINVCTCGYQTGRCNVACFVCGSVSSSITFVVLEIQRFHEDPLLWPSLLNVGLSVSIYGRGQSNLLRKRYKSVGGNHVLRLLPTSGSNANG